MKHKPHFYRINHSPRVRHDIPDWIQAVTFLTAFAIVGYYLSTGHLLTPHLFTIIYK